VIEDNHDGTYEIECDECGTTGEYEADRWHDLMEQIKDDGWRSHRGDNGAWEHYCYDCWPIIRRVLYG
jgi:hypothetical protein